MQRHGIPLTQIHKEATVPNNLLKFICKVTSHSLLFLVHVHIWIQAGRQVLRNFILHPSQISPQCSFGNFHHGSCKALGSGSSAIQCSAGFPTRECQSGLACHDMYKEWHQAARQRQSKHLICQASPGDRLGAGIQEKRGMAGGAACPWFVQGASVS